MSEIKVPFFKPPIGAEEIAEVVDSLENGWITSGPKCARFEKAIEDYLGEGIHCVAVNSCTAGMHLVLAACDFGPGDEIIVPSLTFTATAEVISYTGATPVLADVDLQSQCIDIEDVKRKITPKTKAIMPVHFGGRACDMDALNALADTHDLVIIEDAAHALPTTYKGKLIGTLDTKAAVFSFYANKTITTGEGGMIATKDADLAERCRVLRLHGMSRTAIDRFSSGKWHYDVLEVGYKYNLTDVAASIGIHQMKKVDTLRDRRAEKVALYRKYIAEAELPLHLPIDAAEGDTHSWHLFPVRLNETVEKSRDQVVDDLREDGIICSVHYRPLHMMTHWKNTLNVTDEDFPVATQIFKGTFSLPLFPDMTEEHIKIVVNSLKKSLSG